jgi:phosphate/sulfate permease
VNRGGYAPPMSQAGTVEARTNGSAAAGDDWVVSTADTIERLVDSVRSKTAEPAERVARLLVFGILAAIVGLAAGVLAVVGLFRGLVVLLDVVWQPEVWLAYLILGGIFLMAGLFLWRKRTTKTVGV